MIDFDKLTDEEIIQLENDVRSYIINKKIPEPNFCLNNSINIEQSSFVNPSTLIPTLEIKISVNKEYIQTYRVLWESYYKKRNQFYGHYDSLSPEDRVTNSIKNAIELKFSDYLNTVFMK